MSAGVTNWVAGKLVTNLGLAVVGRTPEDFLIVKAKNDSTFLVAVLGVKGVIDAADVEPLFAGVNKPDFVVNIPSDTLWSGVAIDRIHAASAAFGTLGDVSRAANAEDASTFRDKNLGFFINAMKQHSNVSRVSYVFDAVFRADRKTGKPLTIAVIDAYNMSAEDVRNARTRFGHFDVIVKSSSHGSITNQANAAAMTMGAEALTFGGLMGRLAK